MLDLCHVMAPFQFIMLLLVPIFYMLFHQNFLMFQSELMSEIKVRAILRVAALKSIQFLGSIRARKLNILTLKDVEKIPYPLELEPVAKTPYFAKVNIKRSYDIFSVC